MTDSTQTTTGWIVFLAAMGMLFGMVAIDMVAIDGAWNNLTTPAFIGTTIGHIASVIAAFIGGKLIPVERDSRVRSRAEDIPIDGTVIKKVVEISSVIQDDKNSDKQ